MKLKIVGLLCASVCISAFAAEGKWTEGYGQGNLEYFIDQKGVRLYIGCPTSDGSPGEPSSVSLIQIKKNVSISNFTIQVGNHNFQGPFDSGSRVGENNFIALIEALRKNDAVVKANNQTITFPKSDAAKVLPAYNKLHCNTF